MRTLLVNNYSEKWRLDRLHRKVGSISEVEVVDYSSLVYKDWKDYDVVVLSGSQADLVQKRNLLRFRREIELVLEAEIPVLGICFGHELVCRAFGSRLKRGSKFYKGFHKVRAVREDEIFSGLGRELWLYESHGWVVELPPREMLLLAEGDGYEVECVKHKRKPIYGIQAHPERYDEQHPEGLTILRNFLKLSSKDF